MWDIKRTSDVLCANISAGCFHALRPIARKSRCRVHILAKRGFPFQMKRLKQRKMWILGAFLLVFVVIYLSCFVWFVEVRGAERIDVNKVLACAAKWGLRPGMLRSAADIEKIETRIVIEISELSWAGIRFQGTRAIIEIIEKDMPPSTKEMAGHSDIVAAKDGVVERLISIQGEPLVMEGDAVSAGQILISGVVTQPGNPGTPPSIRYIRAQGIVESRVWYESYCEVKLARIKLERTGSTFRRCGLKFGNKDILWIGSAGMPFARYNCEEKRLSISNQRNIKIPVEVIYQVYHELMECEQVLDMAQAKDEALNRCMLDLDAQIPISAERIKVTSNSAGGEGWVGVKVTIETIENIGVETEVP